MVSILYQYSSFSKRSLNLRRGIGLSATFGTLMRKRLERCSFFSAQALLTSGVMFESPSSICQMIWIRKVWQQAWQIMVSSIVETNISPEAKIQLLNCELLLLNCELSSEIAPMEDSSVKILIVGLSSLTVRQMKMVSASSTFVSISFSPFFQNWDSITKASAFCTQAIFRSSIRSGLPFRLQTFGQIYISFQISRGTDSCRTTMGISCQKLLDLARSGIRKCFRPLMSPVNIVCPLNFENILGSTQNEFFRPTGLVQQPSRGSVSSASFCDWKESTSAVSTENDLTCQQLSAMTQPTLCESARMQSAGLRKTRLQPSRSASMAMRIVPWSRKKHFATLEKDLPLNQTGMAIRQISLLEERVYSFSQSYEAEFSRQLPDVTRMETRVLMPAQMQVLPMSLSLSSSAHMTWSLRCSSARRERQNMSLWRESRSWRQTRIDLLVVLKTKFLTARAYMMLTQSQRTWLVVNLLARMTTQSALSVLTLASVSKSIGSPFRQLTDFSPFDFSSSDISVFVCRCRMRVWMSVAPWSSWYSSSRKVLRASGLLLPSRRRYRLPSVLRQVCFTKRMFRLLKRRIQLVATGTKERKEIMDAMMTSWPYMVCGATSPQPTVERVTSIRQKESWKQRGCCCSARTMKELPMSRIERMMMRSRQVSLAESWTVLLRRRAGPNRVRMRAEVVGNTQSPQGTTPPQTRRNGMMEQYSMSIGQESRQQILFSAVMNLMPMQSRKQLFSTTPRLITTLLLMQVRTIPRTTQHTPSSAFASSIASPIPVMLKNRTSFISKERIPRWFWSCQPRESLVEKSQALPSQIIILAVSLNLRYIWNAGSGRDSPGVSGEERSVPDISQCAVEHDDALETQAGPSVREGSVPEGVDVVLDRLDSDAALFGPLAQELRVVDALRPRADFLPSHEDVVGARVAGVVLAQHRVEGPRLYRVAVQDVEVGPELLSDDGAQLFLSLGVEVVERVNLEALLLEELDSLREGELDHRVDVLEGLELVLLVDGPQLLPVLLLQLPEDEGEHVPDHVQHLEVVLLYGHLDVQPYKLGRMSVRKRVLRPEHRRDLEHLREVAQHRHLLVQLRGLRQARLLPEVVQLEHVGSTLGSAGYQLGRVNFHEALGQQECPEVLAHCGLNVEDGLLGRSAQVNHSVVESRLQLDFHQLLFLFLALIFLALFLFFLLLLLQVLVLVLGNPPARVIHLEGQLVGCSVHHKELFYLQLKVFDRAGLDCFFSLYYLGLDIHNALFRHSFHVLDELFRCILTLKGGGLRSHEVLPQLQEGHVALDSGAVDPHSKQQPFTQVGLIRIRQ